MIENEREYNFYDILNSKQGKVIRERVMLGMIQHQINAYLLFMINQEGKTFRQAMESMVDHFDSILKSFEESFELGEFNDCCKEAFHTHKESKS